MGLAIIDKALGIRLRLYMFRYEIPTSTLIYFQFKFILV